MAWQIDPFGHSREQANIFAHMGFDGLFFGRLDYDDKNKRMNTKTMEMIWSADVTDNTGDSDLFTGALFHAYSPPPGQSQLATDSSHQVPFQDSVSTAFVGTSSWTIRGWRITTLTQR